MLFHKYAILERIFYVSLGAVPGSFIRIIFTDPLAANIFGALIFGFIAGFGLNERYKLIIAIGFCGSCTTFSGWMIHMIELIFDGSFELAAYSLLSNLTMGLLAILLAFYFGRKTKRLILHQ